MAPWSLNQTVVCQTSAVKIPSIVKEKLKDSGREVVRMIDDARSSST